MRFLIIYGILYAIYGILYVILFVMFGVITEIAVKKKNSVIMVSKE